MPQPGLHATTTILFLSIYACLLVHKYNKIPNSSPALTTDIYMSSLRSVVHDISWAPQSCMHALWYGLIWSHMNIYYGRRRSIDMIISVARDHRLRHCMMSRYVVGWRSILSSDLPLARLFPTQRAITDRWICYIYPWTRFGDRFAIIIHYYCSLPLDDV